MAGYYNPKKDYSKAIEEAKAAGRDTSRLEAERQNKINDKYGGKEPTMYGSNKTYSQASRDNDRDTISNAISIRNSRGPRRPASNGSRNTGGNVRTPSNGRGSRGSDSNGNRVTNLPGNAQPAQATPTPLAPAQLPALNQYGYRDMDYTTAIQNATSAAERAQLMQERANKIKYQYGGVEPNMTGSNQKFSETQAGRTNNTSFDNNFAQNTFSAGANYADEAAKHAAQGDWGAVEQDLIQRQAKIDAQGGNNRGLTNQQLLQQLQQQYGATYAQLSQRDQDRMTLISGGKLPYTAYNGVQGYLERGSGWQPDIDYLDLAQQYAKMGDLDGAYEALMRRGFKMYDTGSNGNGISQDQAYAMIDSLWRTSPTAQQTYQAEMDQNARWIAESGAKPNPKNAYKTKKVMGANNTAYWITYDGNGNPVIADHVSRKVGYENKHTSYTPDQIDYLAKYYSGQAGDYSQAYIGAHNIYVTQTGNGRLIDNYGNYASGESPVSTNAKGYTGSLYSDGANTNQDRAALMSVQQRIDAGEQFGALGPSTGVNGTVPIVQTTPMPGNSVIGGSGSAGGGIGGGIGGTGTGETGNTGNTGNTGYEYTGTDLTDYLKELYAKNLEAELANLKSTYDTNVADLEAQQKDIKQQFEAARNQTAAQYDLGRMRFNEYALANGLNTGTAGQGVLAQSAAYQGNLADIGSQEASAMSDNSLQLTNLEAQYNAAINEAKATGDFQLAQALYDELVRQENVAIQQQLAAQEQANWEKQFEYQQQLAAQSQSNWERQFAYQQQLDSQDYAMSQQQLAAQSQQRDYEYAMTLLSSGVMPDLATLQSAGISQGEAAFMQQMVLGSMNTTTTNKAASKAGGTHISGAKPVKTNTSRYNNGSLTTAQVKQLQNKLGVTADGKWGRKSSTAAGGLTADEAWAKYGASYDMSFEELKRTLTRYLSLGGAQRAQNILDAHWDSLTPAQQLELSSLFG